MIVLPADWVCLKFDPVGVFLGVGVVLEANFDSSPQSVVRFVAIVDLGVVSEAEQLNRVLAMILVELNWESGPDQLVGERTAVRNL